MREEFDEIYDSIVNGQFKQAFEQMSHIDRSDLLDYLANELEQPEMAIKAAKIYFDNESRG